MRGNMFETAVGAIVIMVAVAFLAFAFNAAGAGPRSGGYTVEATFDSAGGLAVGSDVKIAGIKVGAVSGLEIDQETFYAKALMTIDRGIVVPDDTTATITVDGLLSSSYVRLNPGASEDNLTDGSKIPIYQTQGSVDLISLISRAVFSSGGGGSGSTGEEEPDR